jgi:hypothetical protein
MDSSRSPISIFRQWFAATLFCASGASAEALNASCEFTYTGGGGGTGGPFCSERSCTEDSECNCNGVAGSCGPDWTCCF